MDFGDIDSWHLSGFSIVCGSIVTVQLSNFTWSTLAEICYSRKGVPKVFRQEGFLKRERTINNNDVVECSKWNESIRSDLVIFIPRCSTCFVCQNETKKDKVGRWVATKIKHTHSCENQIIAIWTQHNTTTDANSLVPGKNSSFPVATYQVQHDDEGRSRGKPQNSEKRCTYPWQWYQLRWAVIMGRMIVNCGSQRVFGRWGPRLCGIEVWDATANKAIKKWTSCTTKK